MTTLRQNLRKQLTIRPSILAICVLALASLLVGPAVGSGTSTHHKVTMILDDVNDVGNLGDLDTWPADADDANGNGNGNGNGNNGHGNNDDGVDSSNPSQGHGGPNGQADESCPDPDNCVDDETQP